MSSPGWPPPELDAHTREQFDIQRAWLRNVLRPSREVCPICRGIRDPEYALCFSCSQTRRRSDGLAARAVVPISYSLDTGQHYHQLKVYKSPTSPNRLARYRLALLYTIFITTHRDCLHRVAGGPFTHVATVPSTRERTGVHPLNEIIAVAHGRLPFVTAVADPAHGNAREFLTDRFSVPSFSGRQEARVLLVDDLWVTGARAQSMAHALRQAGARTVVTVVLGRQVKNDHAPSRRIIETIGRAPFDVGRCAVDDLAV